MAMAAADFTGGEAEELRRAIGFRRSEARMRAVEARLRAGMAAKGIAGEPAEAIVRAITSFAAYGFPESHAASFALLVYASAYLKVHHPAEFYAALLNNQPMGFYHPATLVKDAQRRGLPIRPVDIQRSRWLATVEDGAVRLGLSSVRGLREAAGRRLAEARAGGAFRSVGELVRAAGLRREELVTLAEIGALAGLGMTRREALWEVERACRPAGPLFGVPAPPEPSPLRGMTPGERLAADYQGTGLTLGPHPMALARPRLLALGVLQAADLSGLAHGRRVRVAGAAIVRQRPETARGFCFVSLEDETGIANVVIRPGLFRRERPVLTSAAFLLVEGVLERQDGALAVRAEAVRALEPGPPGMPGHDFR